jgi:hypothetical protein
MSTIETKADATTDTAAVFALLHPIFRECVDPEAVRYDLSLPRPIGEHVYATDGTIAVRIKATPEILAAIPPLDSSKRFPQSVPMVFDGEWMAEPAPLPDLSAAPVCSTCKGKRHLKKWRCSECDGEGETICDCCGQDTVCRECNGKGSSPGGPCPDCAGIGIDCAARMGPEIVGGVTLSWRFVEMFTRHRASIYLPVDPGPPSNRKALRFTLPGDIEGVVMPLSR